MYEQFKEDFPRFYSQLQSSGLRLEAVLPGATDDELAELEEMLDLSLPESYKRLLRCARGFHLFGGAIRFDWGHPYYHIYPELGHLTPTEATTIVATGEQWPPPSDGMLCVADFAMESDGDHLLFDVREGLQDGEYPVVYFAQGATPPSTRKLSGSFGEFMEGFLLDGGWDGRRT